MEKELGSLTQCPLFSDISEENLPVMLNCLGAKRHKYHKDQVILAEGSPAKELGIVISGKVQVVRGDYFGNRSIIDSIGPGQIFGEAFACAGVAAMPVAVLAAGETEVMLIDALRITRTCSSACAFHSRMIYNLLKAVVTKNLILDQKIEVISQRSTREKLMTYLLMEAKKNGSNSFCIPYDRQQLADYLEVERSGLSTEIGKLRKEGVIECRRNAFRLL